MRVVALFAAAAALISACHEEDDEEFDADADSATLRREAMYEWYNDHKPTQHAAQYWSRDYMQFVLRVAGDERATWQQLLPHTTGGIAPAVAGDTWVNIGPTKADFMKNGNTTMARTDSGRVRTILVDGTTMYVATAGGGVWRSHDAGASWTPITEGLGSLSIGSLAIDPADHDTLYLGLGDPFDGTGIGLVKSSDGGDSWSSPVFLGDSTVIPQVLVQNGVVFAATNKGLYRSDDGAASFQLVPLSTGSAEAPSVWSIASTGSSGLAVALEASPSVTTGTTNGQVWISADNGATWTQASGVTSSSGIGRMTLASAPSNRSIVYAMAAVPNTTASTDLADFYKSTNGGATWTALNVKSKKYTNQASESSAVGTLLNGQGWYNGTVVVNPTNPSVVFFGGALLLISSADGGSSFTARSNWLGQSGLPYVHADMHASTFDAAGNLYIGCDGGLFKSSDGGASFTDSLNQGLVTHLFYSVGSSPADPDAVIGGLQDNGTRIRSGATSTFDQTLGGDGFGSHINQTDATQMLGTLYYARIYKSTDSGQNWSLASSGISESNNESTAPFITRIATRGSTNELYTFSNTKVYKSTNYAGSWSAIGTPVTSGALRNVGVAPANSNIVGVVASGGRVLLSSNGGASWTGPLSLPNSSNSMSDIRFDAADPNIVYVASVAPDAAATHLWKSTNFGASWTAIDGNGLPRGVPVNMTKADPQDGSRIYAATHLGVYRSMNGGVTWARFGAGMPLVDVTDLYISPDGTLVRAATFGRGVWQLVSSGAEPSGFSMVAAPLALATYKSTTLSTTVSTAVTNGEPQTITLAAVSLPPNVTATFDPPTITSGGSSTLTLKLIGPKIVGTHSATIWGTGPTASQSTTIRWTVKSRLID